MTDRSRLDPRNRPGVLDTLGARDFDVVVVGGGVVGCGVAVDAAARGLTVALLEADDLASGTSSRSGKILHAGLRFAERFDVGLVRQTFLERDLMVDRLCPHLVRPESFLVPLEKPWHRFRSTATASLHDLLRATGPRSVPRHRQLTRRAVLEEAPALRPDIVRGAVRYFDVRIDDARHTMLLARTAASLGATIVTRVRAVELVHRAGRVRGVRVRDADSGRQLEVNGRVVVNATGVWAERLQGLAGAPKVSVTPAKGVHIVVPGDRIRSRTSFLTRTRKDMLLMRKWGDSWLVGMTDTQWDLDVNEPAATRSDVEYVLSHANHWLRDPLDLADVRGVYAGLRPLLASVPVRDPTKAPRRGRVIVEDPPGLVTVVGGTYTSYRVMAREAVDLAVARLYPFSKRAPESTTDRVPVLGASGFRALEREIPELVRVSGLSEAWIDHLLGRYGSLTTEIIGLIEARPELGKPLREGHCLAAEIVYAAEAEGAMHLVDALVRRTRVGLEAPTRGVLVAPEAARLMGDVLGWSAERRASEVEAYRLEVEADHAAILEPTDAEAVAARNAILQRAHQRTS